MEDWEDDMSPDGSTVFFAQAWTSPAQQQVKSLWEWSDPEDVPFRVAVIGAGGTDKKALAQALASKLDVPCIHSVPRTVKSIGGQLNSKATVESEMLIWLAQLWEQLEYDEYVTASSLIEVCAYIHWLIENNKIDNAYFMRAIQNVTWNIAQNDYSIVFYVPYEGKKLKSDKVRSTSQAFHQRIDQLIKYYLDAFAIDYLPISGTTSQRVTTCLQYLKDYDLYSES